MSAVVCHFEHLAHLNLLHIERKAVSETRLGVVKPERQLVKFESAISGICAATVTQRLHRRRRQRFETLGYFERLLQRFGLMVRVPIVQLAFDGQRQASAAVIDGRDEVRRGTKSGSCPNSAISVRRAAAGERSRDRWPR